MPLITGEVGQDEDEGDVKSSEASDEDQILEGEKFTSVVFLFKRAGQ